MMTKNLEVRRLRPEQQNIKAELDFIVDRAQKLDGRIVNWGPLILFSTNTGDAWMLDLQDNLASRLAQEGNLFPTNITETKENLSIDWQGTFQISENLFLFADRSGRVTTISGYPIRQILDAIGRLGVIQ